MPGNTKTERISDVPKEFVPGMVQGLLNTDAISIDILREDAAGAEWTIEVTRPNNSSSRKKKKKTKSTTKKKKKKT